MVTSTSVHCPPPPKTPKSISRPSFNGNALSCSKGYPKARANVLEINLKIPVSLSSLLKYCGKGVPQGFQCA
ncbi:hypothetical protein Goari_006414 [Gossypium aridum]|uniref:Hydrophobic seed protein domain-containing protein n=1 Tax=Gossypium aridum TaxID=34290 RepID=A0A7J8XN57_GOSAI|nr:hypothetical protein [Gossypium aridum]